MSSRQKDHGIHPLLVCICMHANAMKMFHTHEREREGERGREGGYGHDMKKPKCCGDSPAWFLGTVILSECIIHSAMT